MPERATGPPATRRARRPPQGAGWPPRRGASTFGCALAAIALAPAAAEAQLAVEDPLHFGEVPIGAEVEILPDDARAGALSLVFESGEEPCAIEPVEIEFQLTEPMGAPVELGFQPDSGRVWEEADPAHFVEFQPGAEIAEFPASPSPSSPAAAAFPARVGIGAAITVPEGTEPGDYTAAAEVSASFARAHPVFDDRCLGATGEFFRGEIPVAVTVPPQIDVEAMAEAIDLGMLLRGDRASAPADGSGAYAPARFEVTGPASLDYELRVEARDLEHETAADELPLWFSGGLFGLHPESPETAFESGDAVGAGDHGGGPLYIHAGYEVEVPEDAAEGRYAGEVELTVEILLH